MKDDTATDGTPTDATRRWPRSAVVVLATIAMLVPAAAWAGHRFTDVPTGTTFHDDITWLADTGVTRGCNPPANDRFCPDSPVTRAQMAAFLHRLETEDVFVPADELEGLLPIATFTFFTDTTIATQATRSPVTGDVTVADNGLGEYRVTLPGVSYGLATGRAVCTHIGSPGHTVSVASLAGTMWVRVRDAAGAAAEPVNSGVSCAVYGP